MSHVRLTDDRGKTTALVSVVFPVVPVDELLSFDVETANSVIVEFAKVVDADGLPYGWNSISMSGVIEPHENGVYRGLYAGYSVVCPDNSMIDYACVEFKNRVLSDWQRAAHALGLFLSRNEIAGLDLHEFNIIVEDLDALSNELYTSLYNHFAPDNED